MYTTIKYGSTALKQLLPKISSILIIALFLLFSAYKNVVDKQEYSDQFIFATQVQIKNLFQNNNALAIANGLDSLVKDVYYENNYKPIWTFETQLNKQAVEALHLLENAKNYGLSSQPYQLERIHKAKVRLEQITDKHQLVESRAFFEIELTRACFRFMHHLKNGPIKFDSLTLSENEKQFYIERFLIAFDNNSFKTAIESVQPNFIEYRNLQRALERFVHNTSNARHKFILFSVKDNKKQLKQNAIRTLQNLGYLSYADSLNEKAIYNAVRNFQHHRQLDSTGRLNRKTIKEMEKQSDHLYAQAAHTLNQLRTTTFAPNMVYVNIPSYSVKIIQNNSISSEYRTVVGKIKNKTPLIESEIDRVVVNPYWIVPKKIAFNEIIPRMKKDSTYLKRNGFELIDRHKNIVDIATVDWENITSNSFEYVFRQKSFSGNALGKVKFLFKNDYSVYLHDTPGKKYFSHTLRAYSHGCVRVDKPMDFASDLLYLTTQNNELKRLNSQVREEIIIDKPVKIKITYHTCGADEHGNLYFYNDVYGYYHNGFGNEQELSMASL